MKCSESDLIRRMLGGDRTSFDDIVGWYSEDVLRLCCLLLRDREEAKDVLQESFLRLIRLVRKSRFRATDGSIKGFLMTAARNLCIDRLKKRIKSCVVHEETLLTDPTLLDRRGPDVIADEARLRSEFESALSHLNDVQRTILILHELNGESQKDIADTLQISLNAVRSHLCRARMKMRAFLAPYVGKR